MRTAGSEEPSPAILTCSGNAGKARLRTQFFCDMTPYIWVNCYRCFEGSYCLHLQGKSGLSSWTPRTLQIKPIRSLETSEVLAEGDGVTCRTTVLAIPLRYPRKSRGDAATNQATAPHFIAQFDSVHSALLTMFQNNNIQTPAMCRHIAHLYNSTVCLQVSRFCLRYIMSGFEIATLRASPFSRAGLDRFRV